jgi:thiol-disulfide isomerase/thioredoxin
LFENNLMDSRRAFTAGVVVGAAAMFIAAVALLGLRRYEQGRAEQTRIATPYDELPALQFPDASKLPDYGKADGNWTFRTLDGQTENLSEFRGKVVFLGFWATWCSDCRGEFSSIDTLRKQLGNAPIAFVLVSDENPQKVRGFLEKLPFHLPVYVTSEKPPPVFATFELPTTYVLTPDGTVVYRHLGAARWNEAPCVNFFRELTRQYSAAARG